MTCAGGHPATNRATGAPTQRDEPMPTEGLTPPGRTWLAGCIMHRDLPVGAPGAEVKINGRPFPTLLDSGSAVSLIQPCVLAPCGETKSSFPITCVHGETRHVPDRRVTICTRRLAGGSGCTEGSASPRPSWEGLTRF